MAIGAVPVSLELLGLALGLGERYGARVIGVLPWKLGEPAFVLLVDDPALEADGYYTPTLTDHRDPTDAEQPISFGDGVEWEWGPPTPTNDAAMQALRAAVVAFRDGSPVGPVLAIPDDDDTATGTESG